MRSRYSTILFAGSVLTGFALPGLAAWIGMGLVHAGLALRAARLA